jgi:HD superfamily phosphohydrolase
MTSQQIRENGKVFRDPVHRLIRVDREDQFILDLINTPEFQRLRRVRQLGVSSLTYHGAEHSRFVHSLGVFNFAQRIIASLQRRYGAGHEVSSMLSNECRTIKAAALLHDIGHGPFSHMIERAASSSFKHESMTSRLIKSEESAVREVLVDSSIDPERVAEIIDNVHDFRLGVDIVSSQLDADRMDYLLRDSLMTGVEYGVYDAEWLLNAMCVGRDPGADDPDPGHRTWRLCLDRQRGLYAAEQLILARHHMMLQVYMHRVTRGYEVMLLGLFKDAAKLAQEGNLPTDTPPAVLAFFKQGIEMAHNDWLLFDEAAMVAAIQAWSRSQKPDHSRISRASGAFLNRSRLYQGFKPEDRSSTALMGLEKALESVNIFKDVHWFLDNGVHLPYKGVYYGTSRNADAEEASTSSILLGDGVPSRKAVQAESQCRVLKEMDNARESVERIYVDRDVFEKAKPVLKKFKLWQGE